MRRGQRARSRDRGRVARAARPSRAASFTPVSPGERSEAATLHMMLACRQTEPAVGRARPRAITASTRATRRCSQPYNQRRTSHASRRGAFGASPQTGQPDTRHKWHGDHREIPMTASRRRCRSRTTSWHSKSATPRVHRALATTSLRGDGEERRRSSIHVWSHSFAVF